MLRNVRQMSLFPSGYVIKPKSRKPVRRITMTSKFRWPLAIIFCGAASTADAQTISGVVLDSTTQTRVVGATLMVYEGRKVLADLKTDSTGRFDIPVEPKSSLVLQVTALGYDPYTIRLQSSMPPFAVRMKAAPVSVEGVTATAERRDPQLDLTGFYHRKRAEIGTFITPEEIRKRDPRRISDLFHTVAGARIVQRGAGFEVVSRRFSSGQRATCLPAIYLDNMLVGRGNLDNIVPAEDLLAVEAYMSAARIPPQYGGSNAACGVILLWTRFRN